MPKDHKNSAGSWKRGAILAACTAVCVVGLTWASGSPTVKSGLTALKIIPTPEHYTELYFNNVPQLPSVATGVPVTFSFNIHNVEGSAVLYRYNVVFVSASGVRQTIISNSVRTNSGQTVTIPETVTLSRGLSDSQMIVELPAMHQSIDWWIGKTQ